MHKKALIAGIGAIFCWSLMVGFLRLTTVNYGPELGIALIYTLGAVFLFLLDKPTPLKKIPRRYLLIGGVLFATYELFMAFAVGLAQDSFQAIEVSILNYLWPTLTVLFWAVARKSGRAPALFRVIPGAVLLRQASCSQWVDQAFWPAHHSSPAACGPIFLRSAHRSFGPSIRSQRRDGLAVVIRQPISSHSPLPHFGS